MNIQHATLKDCHLAKDTVVVIDVLRAFTTAAFAFNAGAKEIILVSTLEEAFGLKEEFPDSLLIGEEHGLPIEGFDFGNSPSELIGENFESKVLIQRTSTGTQGVVKSKQAKRILVTGLCTVSATVRYLKQNDVYSVTLVEAGVHNDSSGFDDIACGDLLESLMLGHALDLDSTKQRVLDSPAAAKFIDDSKSSFPLADLHHAIEIDKFDFSMEVTRSDGKAYLRCVDV